MRDRYIPGINELSNSPVGHRIKYYRLQAKLTQKELAAKCDLSESAIRNYELDNRRPKEDILERIADALDVSYFSLRDPDLAYTQSAMHMLFSLQILYGLTPVIIDDEVHLVFPTTFSDLFPYGSPIASMAASWAKKYEEFDKELIDSDTYFKWLSKFPDKVPDEDLIFSDADF